VDTATVRSPTTKKKLEGEEKQSRKVPAASSGAVDRGLNYDQKLWFYFCLYTNWVSVFS